MGLSESRSPVSLMKRNHDDGHLTKSHDVVTQGHSAAASKQRDSHLLFYDASKGSVAIFTDANTLTKKFRTRKIELSSSQVITASPPTTSTNNGIIGQPAPPPYEVTLGRTPNVESFLHSLVTNDENSNYTSNDRCISAGTLNLKLNHTDSAIGFCETKLKESQNKGQWSPNGQHQAVDLQQIIEIHNLNSSKGYEIELVNGTDTFHGFIRVSMNLSHPINVFAGCKPPSIYDIMYEDQDSDRTLTSFYLPRDTVKALHVNSDTTTQELITILLRKFKVADNPQKYCLYEKYCEGEGSVKGVLRRMQNYEKPLWLVLCWPREDALHRRLVLQENDTGDILWEEFSFPELSNFLKILDREEEEYLKLVRVKYKILASRMRKAMKQFEPTENPIQSDSSDEEEYEDEMDL